MNIDDILKMANLPTLFFAGLFIILSLEGKAQSDTTFHVYLIRPSLAQMTKTDFLQTDSISMICGGCKVFDYTIVLSLAGKVKYWDVYGNKIPHEAKEIVKNTDSCIVTFDNIKGGRDRYNWQMIPPLAISIH